MYLCIQGRSKEAMDMFRNSHTLSSGRSKVVQAINLGEAHFVSSHADSHEEGLEWLRRALKDASSSGLLDLKAAALRGLVNHLSLLCEDGGVGHSDARMKEGVRHRKQLIESLQTMRGSPQGGECPISMEAFTDTSLVVVLECYHMMDKTAWNQYVRCVCVCV